MAAKKPAKKTASKGNGFDAPLTPSAALAEIVGAKPLPRAQVAKKIWEYIHKHKLQDTKNKRQINPDDKLGAVLGKKSLDMFAMTKKYNEHLSK
jgi:upstream activation factor subunit UAF30